MENPFRLGVLILALLALGAGHLTPAASAAERDSAHLDDPAENRLKSSLRLLQRGQLDAAVSSLDTLIAQHPTFQLAHAVRANIAAQVAGQASVFEDENAKLASLTNEAKQRFASQSSAAQRLNRVPANLLELGPQTGTIVLVDLTANRLFLYRNHQGQLLSEGDHYVTIGKAGAGKLREGDNRTPIGLYRVQPFLTDESLPELYGYGALPLDYPNLWDRHLGRTGSGIWIHGQPRDSYARPPHDSEGCVVISNRAMPGLRDQSHAGATPVLMVEAIEWVDRLTLQDRRKDLHNTIEAWRKSWSGGDINQFMSLHSESYRNDHAARDDFERRKRELAELNDYQKISITNREMLMFEDIGGTPVAEVRFTQRYRSPRYEESSYKTQYWSLRGGKWLLELESEQSEYQKTKNTRLAKSDRTTEIERKPITASDIPGSR